MNLDSIKKVLAENKQPAFRLAQAKRAFYTEVLPGWESLSTFPKNLREMLAKEIPWDELKVEKIQESANGNTVKVLFECQDGSKIESVLMRHDAGRNTVCVSSQVGCPMKCAFCATGKLGLKRSLSRDEIAEQVIFFSRRLKAEGAHVTNVVFMGMGEPFNNYDNFIAAARLLNDPDGLNLGARHLTVSTCGLVPGIEKFADEKMQINLAVSLHSAIPETRATIMPVEKAYPLDKLMAAVDAYVAKTNRKVLFEYLLLDGVNDSPRDARELAELMKRNLKLYQVNLIKYHTSPLSSSGSTGGSADATADSRLRGNDMKKGFKASSLETRQMFMDILKQAGVLVTFRVSFGEDIDAACGQLAGKTAEEE